MTRNELSTIVRAHTCIIHGITYHFEVRGITVGESEEPAFACALLHVDVTGGQSSRSSPVAKLFVTAPLTQPAKLPILLTDALHEHLHTRGLDGPNLDEPTTHNFGDSSNQLSGS